MSDKKLERSSSSSYRNEENPAKYLPTTSLYTLRYSAVLTTDYWYLPQRGDDDWGQVGRRPNAANINVVACIVPGDTHVMYEYVYVIVCDVIVCDVIVCDVRVCVCHRIRMCIHIRAPCGWAEVFQLGSRSTFSLASYFGSGVDPLVFLLYVSSI